MREKPREEKNKPGVPLKRQALSFMCCHVMTGIITSVIGLFIKTGFSIPRTSILTFLIWSWAVDQDERKIKLCIEELLIELGCI